MRPLLGIPRIIYCYIGAVEIHEAVIELGFHISLAAFAHRQMYQFLDSFQLYLFV